MNRQPVHHAVYDTYADWETGHATAYLARAGYGIRTVGPGRDPVTSIGGLRVQPECALDDVRPSESSLLILPGADLWDSSGDLAPFARKAREFLDAGVPVAAICGATYGLALEGLLDERAHTSNAAEYLAFTGYAGADRYVAEPAVTDGDLITASGTAPVHFARAIFARLGLYEPGVAASWFKLYGDRDPAGFYELMSA